MPEKETITWYPGSETSIPHKLKFLNGNFDKDHQAEKALSAGQFVTVDSKGFILDIWDPHTKK
ncbi:unnamed protein product, partial [marine sediment metagenome]